jgi:hypothetical protein
MDGYQGDDDIVWGYVIWSGVTALFFPYLFFLWGPALFFALSPEFSEYPLLLVEFKNLKFVY